MTSVVDLSDEKVSMHGIFVSSKSHARLQQTFCCTFCGLHVNTNAQLFLYQIF